MTIDLQLATAEVWRDLRKVLSKDRPEHHCTDGLKDKRSGERGQRFHHLTLFRRSKFAELLFMSQVLWYSTLHGHLIETLTTKRIFLWYRSQRDIHLFCKFGMKFT